MNDYQYHYLFASPVIIEIIDLSSHILLIQTVYGDEMRYFTLFGWNKTKQNKKDLETFDLEDFKYNFVNISAFRIVDAESNFTRHLLRDMEKFQPIGQSILNKSNIIQVCRNVPPLVILLIIYYLLYLLTMAIYKKEKWPKIVRCFVVKAEPALVYDSVMALAHGLAALDRGTALRLANLSCDIEQPWNDGSSLFNYINTVIYKSSEENINGVRENRHFYVTKYMSPPSIYIQRCNILLNLIHIEKKREKYKRNRRIVLHCIRDCYWGTRSSDLCRLMYTAAVGSLVCVYVFTDKV